jgi:hypothetical protein
MVYKQFLFYRGQRERKVASKDCFILLDYSTFSKGEIDSLLNGSTHNAIFTFYVVAEGYSPSEIGINTALPISPQLSNPPNKPSISIPILESIIPSGLTIEFSGPLRTEDPTLPDSPQRFTFPFTMTFLNSLMFDPNAVISATLYADFQPPGGQSPQVSAPIAVTPNPNPYILHGDPPAWFLSQDLKVFYVDQLQPKFGHQVGVIQPGSTSAQSVAIDFITSVVNDLRNNIGTTRADFDGMAQDEAAEQLQLSQLNPITKLPVYNFAIARVRLQQQSGQQPSQNAINVRLFFRTWQAQRTNATYNDTTFARETNTETPIPQPIPVLGIDSDEIITIPFFASARVDPTHQLHTQADDFNRHDIDLTQDGETDFFFGCWLDINQPNDLRYPKSFVGVPQDGPFTGDLISIQQCMKAGHQCLIAEIAYDLDPIPSGVDPSNSDKLAQRNLTFMPAPNPGNQESRLVPHTFEVKPTSIPLQQGIKPDELMIEWNALPTDSFAEVYFPAVSADAILAMASEMYTTQLLQLVDEHTIRFPATDVTYIPIPQGQGMTFAGLLTVDLPSGIKDGDNFTAIIRQITSVPSANDRQWRRTTGSFCFTIPVSTKERLLKSEEQYLSLMKWSNEAIPATGRWQQVMQRYLSQLEGRVISMGGDPTTIPPTGTGIWFVGMILEPIVDPVTNRFEGFVLRTTDGRRERFESRDRHVEQQVMHALERHRRVVVLVDPLHHHHATSIIILE